jgi:hypothetical protein
MAQTTTGIRAGNGLTFTAGTGTIDNSQVFLTGDVTAYDTFMLMSTAGAMDVFPSLDGTNFATTALSLQDLGATTSSPVLVTAANRVYGFRGKFKAIRVDQNGATPVTAATLTCGKT